MKKFVNFRFVVTLVLAIFANVATYAQDNVVDEVVWVVGDEAILKSDVEEARMDALCFLFSFFCKFIVFILLFNLLLLFCI